MKHSARVLTCRSAPLATAYCVQLCEAFSEVGQALRHGDNIWALQRFEAALEPMQKLLVFVAVAADLLRDAQHPLRPELVKFSRGMERALDLVEAAVVSGEPAAVVSLLETRVVPMLDAYKSVGPRLTAALQPRLAAA
ncbi:MAG: hypothetical protein KUG77_13265 [Nannocystaceae bacterium]|nr:hypothetical protein [Nannocystaceae bacterium]